MENNIEKGKEQIPTKEEVLEIIIKRAESPEKVTTLREISDDQGLKLLDLRIEEKEPGATAEYLYCRKGVMPNGIETKYTSIVVSYFQDGQEIGGSEIAFYNSENGSWEEVK